MVYKIRHFAQGEYELTKITVFGGDMRMRVAADELASRGFAVDTLGLYPDDRADCASSDVFLLPVPASRDGRTVAAPLTDKIIPLSYIEETAGDRLVLSSVWKPNVKNFIDYYSDDAYAVKNAVPTAEGAIRLALELTDFTLSGSRVLVTGYGRCGRVLCSRLYGLHCVLSAAARRPEVLAQIEADGITPLKISDLPGRLGEFDVIFNTVDAPWLEGLDTNAVVIDLATKGCVETAPGGFVYKRAPGLPGKTAPRTAGIILADTVQRLIKDYGV